MTLGDTIVAPATPFGHSGVAVIRITGPMSFSIIRRLSKKQRFTNRLATVCSIIDSDGKTIDTSVVTVYKKPDSYTGEDVVEISSHGNPTTVQYITSSACAAGARAAEGGEFTKRAFINGKLDLVQVEAVASLIDSKSIENTRHQQKILRGALSHSINNIRTSLISLLGQLEHQMDIDEEDWPNDPPSWLIDGVDSIYSKVRHFKKSSRVGRLLNRGATIVLAGPPNVGKSTLLNALTESSRAIVNSEPGTTRDTIEGEVLMGGVPVRFVDTAGLRKAASEIEKEGIRRTKSLLKRSDLIISLTDRLNTKHLGGSKVPTLSVVNKSDLRSKNTKKEGVIHISAQTGDGIVGLKRKISQRLGINKISTEAPYLSTSRQQAAMALCSDAMLRSQSLIKNNHLDIEIIAFELRDALSAVDSLLGKTSPDDILNSVFSSFCVGK